MFWGQCSFKLASDQKRDRCAIGSNEGSRMINSRHDRRGLSLRHEIALATCGLVMLLAAQWVLSNVIVGSNYFGFDGKMAQTVALTAFKFGGYLDVTNLNPIQGVGSQLLPKNAWGNPSLWA